MAPTPSSSRPAPAHKLYPYLLRGLYIERADQVWCADITYIPMPHGFVYLAAVMEWYSRYVLAQHGRQGPCYGQHRGRTPMAPGEIRGGLSQRLPERWRAQGDTKKYFTFYNTERPQVYDVSSHLMLAA